MTNLTHTIGELNSALSSRRLSMQKPRLLPLVSMVPATRIPVVLYALPVILSAPSLHPDVLPQTGDCNTDCSIPLPAKVVKENTDVPYLDPPIPPMSPPVISTPDSQLLGIQPQTPMHHSPIPQPWTSSWPHPAGPVPPENTPPTSRRAYLLGREWRGVSGGGVTPRIVASPPGVEGKGFKSSPLNPTERSTLEEWF